jgi:hypothetical protein
MIVSLIFVASELSETCSSRPSAIELGKSGAKCAWSIECWPFVRQSQR